MSRTAAERYENNEVSWGCCWDWQQGRTKLPQCLASSSLMLIVQLDVSSHHHQQQQQQSFILCQHIPTKPCILIENESSTILCYHFGLRVVPWDTRQQKNDSDHVNDNLLLLKIFEPMLGPQRFSTCELQNSDESQLKCQSTGNNRLHHHIRVQVACSNDTSGNKLDDVKMWISPLTATPIPLHSITLVLLLEISQDKGPLFWAYIKRQMVGAAIVFVEGKATTDLSIPTTELEGCSGIGSILTFRVESISTIRQQIKVRWQNHIS